MKTTSRMIRLAAALLLTHACAAPAIFAQHPAQFPFEQISESPPKTDRREIRAPSSLSEIASLGSRRAGTNSDSRRQFRDGTTDLKRRQEERGERLNPQLTQNTIPYWSDSFTYQGLEFTYKMVGTDPKNGSRTTVIPTEIIPLRFVFPDGKVFDASTDLVDGQTPVLGIINSPIFQNYNFVLNGTPVGNTQYGDAFQRANFWDSVSMRSRNYHVLLGQPTVLPTQTIIVPAGMGTYYHDPFFGDTIPLVNEDFLSSQEQSIRSGLNLSPRSLAITVWGSVLTDSTFLSGTPGAGGWHGTESSNGGLLTFISASYFPDSPDPRADDTYPLSHELAEWMDDPFIDNNTPGWNVPFIEPNVRCNSGGIVRGRLEVADPVAFFYESVVALPGPGFTYHVTEAMFIDFFTRSPHSRSLNGQYSMFTIGAPYGLPSEPSTTCIGSVQADEQYIEFPGAIFTLANGINNRGEVVGYYVDQQNRAHGYRWKSGSFRALDFPGAPFTEPKKITDAGDIVGYFVDFAGLPHGFSYTNGQFRQIDFPGSTDTILLGLNSAGDMVGVYDNTEPITHAFMIRNGVFTKIDTPFGQQAEAVGINDSGVIVGDTWDNPIPIGPFLGFTDEDGLFSQLNMPGAVFTFPRAINNSDMIAGNFDNGSEPYASGFVRIFGFLHEVNAGFETTYVYGNNDLNQICGAHFDFSVNRWKGYVADLPIANHSGN